MAKRKLKTLREQREERIRQFKEISDNKIERFRDRLIKVRTIGKKWSILDGEKFFVCGYCSFRMALYSTQSLHVDYKDPKLFYGCSKRCEQSNIHRASFVDDKIMDFIYERLHEKFPGTKGGKQEMEKLAEAFHNLEELENKRRKMVELLPHAGFDRDDLLKNLVEVEKEIDTLRKRNAGLDSENPGASPLLSAIFSFDKPEELHDLNVHFRTEIVKALMSRIRFFNETLIVKVVPLDEEELKFDEEGGGKIMNIHLARYYQPYRDEDQTEQEEIEEKVPERNSWERVDPEFIMSEEEVDSGFIKASEKIDLKFIMTEPGSPEEEEHIKEKELLKEKEKPEKPKKKSSKGTKKKKSKKK